MLLHRDWIDILELEMTRFQCTGSVTTVLTATYYYCDDGSGAYLVRINWVRDCGYITYKLHNKGFRSASLVTNNIHQTNS